MCFDRDTSVLRSKYTCITDEMHLYYGCKTIVLRTQYANIVDCETASAHTAKPDRRFYIGSDREKRREVCGMIIPEGLTRRAPRCVLNLQPAW